MSEGVQQFSTSEGILAFCLYMAGAEFSDPLSICFHVYDPEILSKLGYKGTKLWDAAQDAWRCKKRGHIEHGFKLSQRTHDLIKIYREQRDELEKSDEKAADLISKVMSSVAAGAMLSDEGVLRISCIMLKVRGEFMNAWKYAVPLLKVPQSGRTKTFDSSVTIRTESGSKTVPAKAVSKPGYKLISLNASEETKKKMGFA